MRRLLWALGILLLAGAGLLALTFTGKALPLEPLPAFKPPIARGPDGMTIAAIRSGTMSSGAMFAFRGGKPGEERQFNMGGILVRHPRGTLLIDTGFGRNIDAHVRR